MVGLLDLTQFSSISLGRRISLSRSDLTNRIVYILREWRREMSGSVWREERKIEVTKESN